MNKTVEGCKIIMGKQKEAAIKIGTKQWEAAILIGPKQRNAAILNRHLTQRRSVHVSADKGWEKSTHFLSCGGKIMHTMTSRTVQSWFTVWWRKNRAIATITLCLVSRGYATIQLWQFSSLCYLLINKNDTATNNISDKRHNWRQTS